MDFAGETQCHDFSLIRDLLPALSVLGAPDWPRCRSSRRPLRLAHWRMLPSSRQPDTLGPARSRSPHVWPGEGFARSCSASTTIAAGRPAEARFAITATVA